MTRESRLLLIVGLLAILGVTSLALIADRYRRLLTEPPGASRSDESRRVEFPLPPVAPSSEDAVTRFAAVRKEVKRAIDDNSRAIESAVDPATGLLKADAREELNRVIPRIADRKLSMLARVGLSGEEYDRIRRAYLAWLRGEGGLDEGLRRSFESRRSRLDELELGALEELDVPTSP
jgi:hypothetical protein